MSTELQILESYLRACSGGPQVVAQFVGLFKEKFPRPGGEVQGEGDGKPRKEWESMTCSESRQVIGLDGQRGNQTLGHSHKEV
jgi:hypothetical protein